MEELLLLRRTPLFSSLSLADLQGFYEKIEIQPFTKGEVICEEGKAGGQALYIVASGQLNILLGEKILTTLSSGSYFGEVSLLTGEPHSATIKAVVEGRLFVIKKEVFEEIVRAHPSVLLWLSQALGKKLRQTAQISYGEKEERRIFVVLSMGRGCGKSVLTANLAASFLKQTRKRTLALDFCFSAGSCASILKSNPALTVSDCLKEGKEITLADLQRCILKHSCGIEVLVFYREGEAISFNKEILSKLFKMLKEIYERVVIDLSSQLNSEQLKIFVGEADKVIFLANESPLALCDSESFLKQLKVNFPDLESKLWTGILLERDKLQKKSPLSYRFFLPFDRMVVGASCVQGIPFVISYLDSPLSQAISRLVREMENMKVGLALSSSMAPALAHIGVLKVLQREKIPIDIVAGTSGGALFGTPYVAGTLLTEVEKAVVKMGILRLLLLIDFTLPYAGFIRGKRIVNLIKAFIGDLRFEELSTPFKVITTDFYTGEIFVMDQGLISEALRATISIPGIFTPFKYKNRYLVDGATVSPVPVDILYRFGADRVIAVNTNTDPLLRERKKKHSWFSKNFPPHFFDVIMHSRGITSYHISEIETRKADIAICPDTSPFNWRDYHLAKSIIGAGEEAAEKALPQIKI